MLLLYSAPLLPGWKSFLYEVRLGNVLQSWKQAVVENHALVVTGDLNHPNICWGDNTAQNKRPRRSLQNTADNFVILEVGEPARRGALLVLALTEMV